MLLAASASAKLWESRKLGRGEAAAAGSPVRIVDVMNEPRFLPFAASAG